MNRLRRIHAGETATIVGSGPSLLALTAGDFVAGPVITLNLSILAVRRLDLPNPIYTMQKDGCIVHNKHAAVPLGCICPVPERMVEPRLPESLLLSVAESSHCFPDYPLRYVVDVRRRFGLRWYTMSAPVAVRIAHLMGCAAVRMLAMDGYVRGDNRRVQGDELVPIASRGYFIAGQQSEAEARRIGLVLSFS